MDKEEYAKHMIDQMRRHQIITAHPTVSGMTNQRTYKPIPTQAQQHYSIAEVQLTNGEMVGMMISASPTLGAHLTKEMSNTGFLYIYNETESLIIKSDLVAAVKLTKFTQE
jgi:hypothetical protein